MAQPVSGDWWELHLRSARGEALKPDEQARYQAALMQLDADEELPGQDARLRETRRRLAELEAENTALRARRAELQREIAEAEAALLRREARRSAGVRG